nr:SAM-dependent methyltransferase [Rhizobium sp. Q54]
MTHASESLPAEQPIGDLVAVVERARSLLDAGDVERALKLSAVAYDQAKAAAGSAERMKASRDLIDKARRMQADALKIESMCYVAMADAVDEAQARGELSRGRPEKVQSEDHFTLEDVGVDKRRLHEARKLRNAVRAEPKFVERIVEARLSEGLEPSRAALKKAAGHAVGTKTATKDERGDDLYETPIEAMRTLLTLESFGLNVLEPSVGKGAILRPLEAVGYDVTIADLVDRGITTKHGECQGVGDFLRSIAEGGGWDIVTNPPYGVANAYAAHALREHKPRKMALLLNLNFMCGFEDRDRCFVMDECPPSRVYVFTRRLPMMHRDGWEGNKASSQMNTAWFIWERNEDGSYGNGVTQLIRVDWKAFENAAPLAPGAGGHIDPIGFSAAPDEFARETPRKSVEERVDEEISRAILWLKNLQPFDSGILRRGIGVRDSVAVALIDAMAANGLIAQDDDGLWMPTGEGISLTATANAAEAVAAWRAGKAVAA